MPIITALKPLYVSKVRIRVYLDGEYAYTLHRRTLKRLGWALGSAVPETPPEELATLERERARELALWLLEHADKSKAQLAEYLRRREYARDAVDATLDMMQKYSFVDDARLAESVVRAANRQSLSRRATLQKLREKGIDRFAAEDAMAQWDAQAERHAAQALAVRYDQKYKNLPARERRQKTSAALARKGFDWEIVRFALRAACAPDEEEEYGYDAEV